MIISMMAATTIVPCDMSFSSDEDKSAITVPSDVEVSSSENNGAIFVDSMNSTTSSISSDTSVDCLK